MTTQVRHIAEDQRYELPLEGGTAYATYRRHGDVAIIDHTVTPPTLRGRGVANRLIKEVLTDMRAQGLKVVPECSFVVAYFARHPEERDLLAPPGAL